MSIGFAGALAGGVLTLLSPCSVMLLPSFFAYAFASPSKLLARTAIFYLGLLTTLVPIGVLAGTAGAFISQNRTLLVSIAAGVVILLGVVQLVGVRLPAISRGSAGEGTSTASVYVLGTIYGLAGVCAGPVLGSVLALAAIGGTPLYGGIVLAVFALGMTVPLFVLSILWSAIPSVRRLVLPREIRLGRWRNSWTQIVSGGLSIAIGVFLLVTDGTASVAGALGASQQFAVESSTLGAAQHVPDLAFVGIAVAILVAVWVVVRQRSRRSRSTHIPTEGSQR